MSTWILLLLASGCFGLSLLTLLRSPDWNPWRLALLVGEFGHLLALGPLAIVLAVAGSRGRSEPPGVLALVVAGAALILLLRPGWLARAAGEAARRELDRMGAPPLARAPFAWRGLWPRPGGTVPVATVPYADGLALDLYQPRSAGPAPCVIVVHGGGWDSGDREQLAGFNHWLAAQGWAVAAVSYRLVPQARWPAPREDVLAAIAFLKREAGRLGIDATRLVLLGRSAGGQIAQVVAYAAHDPAIRGLVGLYAPSDLVFGYKYAREDDVLKSPELMRRFLGGTPETAPAAYESASALRQVAPDSPPTLLIHGEKDTLVWHRHSVRLEAALERVGVPVALISLPWATHAFEFNLSGPGGQITRYALERFLAQVRR